MESHLSCWPMLIKEIQWACPMTGNESGSCGKFDRGLAPTGQKRNEARLRNRNVAVRDGDYKIWSRPEQTSRQVQGEQTHTMHARACPSLALPWTMAMCCCDSLSCADTSYAFWVFNMWMGCGELFLRSHQHDSCRWIENSCVAGRELGCLYWLQDTLRDL